VENPASFQLISSRLEHMKKNLATKLTVVSFAYQNQNTLAQAFYPLSLNAVEKTTGDCVLLSLHVPEQLRETFAFRAGQHLTLRKEINGEDVRRSYSLCSSPGSGLWQVAVKEIPDGVFSSYANHHLKPGDLLEVMPPHGSFTLEPATGNSCFYVAFAAGSGITPILSHIQDKLKNEPEARFVLFYTSRTSADIILKEEIEGIKNSYLHRFEPYFFLSREERDIDFYRGRMDQQKLEHIGKYLLNLKEVSHYLLCGPEEMIFMIRDFLKEEGVAEERIHFELFVTQAASKRKQKAAEQSSSILDTEVTVREGGKNFRFRMAGKSESILEAALRHNSGLPFACKGGVCCTCRAKLLEGEVEMEVNYALEKDEVAAGYILTCQAIPLTNKITVDFDQ
jgi:ring-1,2-phenylacetyl-CoA epoxidase subunit PaaE